MRAFTNSAVTLRCVGIYVKTERRAATKRYKQCSNALFVKALQTLQTLHIFESQARVRI